MNIKKITIFTILLITISSSLIFSTVTSINPFTPSLVEYSYGWAEYATKIASPKIYSTYSPDGASLTYTFDSGGDAGIGIKIFNIFAINMNSYNKFTFTLKSNSPTVMVKFKNTLGQESSLYCLTDISGTNFQTVEINLQCITGNFDRTVVNEIQFQPVEFGTNSNLQIQGIAFDTSPSTITFNTPLTVFPPYTNVNAGATYPALVNGTDYLSALKNVWLGYKSRYIYAYQPIANANAYGLVFDPFSGTSQTAIEASDYSVSEASGYGMLLAVLMNDQATFDLIMNATYRTIYKASTGLFSWRIQTDGRVITANGDGGSAMDADEDIALALIFADALQKRGVWTTNTNYYNKAQDLVDAIYTRDFEYARYIRLGDFYEGGRTLTNLSYFSPAWYKIFSKFENKFHDWKPIIDQGYKTLALSPGYLNGLAPDWCDSYGQQILDSNGQPVSNRAFVVGKDAIRVFLRLGIDAVWFKDSRATTFLEKTRNLIVNNSIALPQIHILNLAGATVGTYDDTSLTSMFVAGAMGSTDTNYHNTAKSAIDSQYLMYVYSGPYSFFSGNYYPPGRFNYFNQSLAMFSCFLLSGAFPNVFADLTNPGTPPSLQASNIPAAIFNKSVNVIPFTLSSPAGGAFISTVNLLITHSGGSISLQLNKENYPSISVIADSTLSLKESSVEYAITNNNLLITLNLLISNNFTQGQLTLQWSAGDYKNNLTGLTTFAGSYTFYPYATNSLGVNSTNVEITNINLSNPINIINVNNPLIFSTTAGPWNIKTFTDRDSSATGQAGFIFEDGNGNIQHLVPISMLVTTNPTTPSNLSDPASVTVNDRQDPLSSIALSGNTLQLQSTNNIFLGFNVSQLRAARYSAKLYFKLTKINELFIDNFDFADAPLMSDLNTYWSPVPLYTTNTVTPTTTNIQLIGNSFNNSPSLRTTYTLGSKTNAGLTPQSITALDLNRDATARNLSGYSGITFWIKADTDTPLAVFLVSPVVTNSDYHLKPIHPLANKWCKYTLYFKDFKQQEFTGGQIVSLSSALNQVTSIQFRTLSEIVGESQSFYLDEISLF